MARWDANDQDLFWTHVMLGARPMGTSHRRWDLLDLHAPHYRLTKDRKASEGWKPRQSEAWDYPIDSFTVARLRNRKELYARPGGECRNFCV